MTRLRENILHAIAVSTEWVDHGAADDQGLVGQLIGEYTAGDQLPEFMEGMTNLVSMLLQRIEQLTGDSPRRTLQILGEALSQTPDSG